MICFALAALGILPVVQFSLAQRGAGDCQWATLRMQTDIYIESQTYGELDPLLTSSSPVYRENYKPRDINTSLLTTPLKIDYTRTFVDQKDCKTYAQLIVTNPKNPYIIGTQITFDNTGRAGLKVKIIDVVISRPSTEPQFNATKTLAHVGTEDWSVIVRAQKDSRDLLKTVANSYLDLWSGNSNFDLPWSTPCARLEGSEYYTEECQPVSVNGETNTNRRYVIDEGLGAVSVLSKGGSDGTLLDIHEFRLVQKGSCVMSIISPRAMQRRWCNENEMEEDDLRMNFSEVESKSTPRHYNLVQSRKPVAQEHETWRLNNSAVGQVIVRS